MLDDLAGAIDGLDIPVDRVSLAQAIALRDRLDARIAEAAVAFDAAGWRALHDRSAMDGSFVLEGGAIVAEAIRLATPEDRTIPATLWKRPRHP